MAGLGLIPSPCQRD